MLGSYAAEQAASSGWATWTTCLTHTVEIPGCRTIQLDIRDPRAVMQAVEEIRPNVVIHAAAIVRPDICEQQKRNAFQTNVLGTYNIIAASEKIGAHMVHVSTDLVFNGEHNPHKEDDPYTPLNYYGLTKVAAECALQAADLRWAIVRTTTLYGPRKFSYSESFSDKVIESLRAERPVVAFIDQFRPAVPVWNVADVLLEVARRRMTGIYHAVCPDVTTRHQFAQRIAKVFGLNSRFIKPMSMDEVAAVARRPKSLVIDPANTARILSTRLSSFDEGIRELRRRMG
jgi:dTDP-4-dehydrorhamnose reductase